MKTNKFIFFMLVNLFISIEACADGCTLEGQTCTCSNTGYAGYCNGNLYCDCN